MQTIDWSEWLGENGPLSEQFEHFQPRIAQQKMAAAIYDAIAEEQHLVCEAPTGTGKTLGYLFPVLLAGKRAIISTGTKHLQQQLFDKDLKLAKKTMGGSVSYSLLKGRRNYLCQYRIKNFTQEFNLLPSKKTYKDLQLIHEWSLKTEDGDISKLGYVSEEAEAWQFATSTIDNCLGKECPDYDSCFVLKARAKAMESDIVVVNHHLLLSDIGLKDEGFGALLPKSDVIVIDEAHQFSEIARNFFGHTFSSRNTMNLLQDVKLEQATVAQDNAALLDLSNQIEKQLKDIRLAFGQTAQRKSWNARGSLAIEGLDELNDNLMALAGELDEQRIRSEGLERCAERAEQLVNSYVDTLPDDDNQSMYWYETYSQSFALHNTPMDIGRQFQQVLDSHGKHWIFTSATVASRDDTSYFRQELGFLTQEQSAAKLLADNAELLADDAETAAGSAEGSSSDESEDSLNPPAYALKDIILDTPFDYRKQALLVNPRGMPDPSTREFDLNFIELCKNVVAMSRGRCFILCTSHRMLAELAEAFRFRKDYTILVQGHQSKDKLLKRFRKEQPAILMGTASFWEGVDVQGDDLSCVIIDRLPFGSPVDPMVKARESWLKKQGKQPFVHYSLPNAVIRLKQGVGRLIRSQQDRGVIVIADPRLCSKNYGKVFLASLPDMPRTRDVYQIEHFFAQQNEK